MTVDEIEGSEEEHVGQEGEQRRFGQAMVEMHRGKPRGLIEGFFWIPDEQKRVVRMKFRPNQEYYYRETWGKMTRCDEAMRVIVLKDRKAESTSFWKACGDAYAIVPPFGDTAWHTVMLLHDEEAAKLAMDQTATVLNNLPDWLSGSLNYKHKARDFYELSWGEEKGGRYLERFTTKIDIATAGTREFGRSLTLSMVVLSEWPHYPRGFDTYALTQGLSKESKVVKESTPSGTDNEFYREYQATKEGKVGNTRLVRYWFNNPRNFLLPTDVDVTEAVRSEGLSDEERELLASSEFTRHDGIEPFWQILWRRVKIAEAVRKTGDSETAVSLFLSEHMENDVDCFANVARSMYKKGRVRAMLAQCRAAVRREIVAPGFELRVWRGPVPGVAYTMGMDTASGKRDGDATCVWVQEAKSGDYVACLYGRPSLHEAAQEAVKLARVYNEAYLGIERTGGWGETAVQVARDMGYRRLYRAPLRPGQDARAWALSTPYGVNMTETAKNEMMTAHVRDINTESATTWDADYVNDMANYDPNSGSHTPDRVIAGYISNMLRSDPRCFENARASGARERRHLLVTGGF